MTYFIKRGANFHVTGQNEFDIRDELPADNYAAKTMPITGEIYLAQRNRFSLPDKLYGNIHTRTKRIIQTFLDRPLSTGVLLSGLKGSGKSLLAKNIGNKLVEGGIPTILVNQPLAGDNFNQFVAKIEQPCCLIFDEFEKVYDAESQEMLLTLLDGVFPSKKLFILTANDKHKIDTNMKNRPGRVYYSIDYKGLEPEDVRAFCEDRLDNKDYIDKVVQILGIFDEFNFDMLQSLVEEMNRYNEGPREALQLLNIRSTMSNEDYTVTIIKGDMVITETDWSGNIFGMIRLGFIDPDKVVEGTKEKDYEDADTGYRSIRLQQHECKKLNADTGEYTFETDTYKLKFKKDKKKWSRWDLVY